jgi:hypothetical protein
VLIKFGKIQRNDNYKFARGAPTTTLTAIQLLSIFFFVVYSTPTGKNWPVVTLSDGERLFIKAFEEDYHKFKQKISAEITDFIKNATFRIT